MLKAEKGVTLVALVITIIVLIILASVSIMMVMDEGGIFGLAKKGKENSELAANQWASDYSNLLGQMNQEVANLTGEE